MSAELFKVTASCHLNFYPGTMNPTPPDYRRIVESAPMSRDAASSKWAEWMGVVGPGWEILVVPAEKAEVPHG